MTSAQIRKRRIKIYIQSLKSIDINAIIHALPSLKLKKLIEQAKEEQIKIHGEAITETQIIQHMIHLQLNTTINDLTNIEKDFLKSQKIAINTYRAQITEYRAEISKLLNDQYNDLQSQYRVRYKKLRDVINQQCLPARQLESAINNIKKDAKLIKINQKSAQIQEDNPVSRIHQIALYKMSVGKIIRQYMKNQYSEKKRQQQEQYKLIDAQKYIKIAERLLKSSNHHELILGICALTGRRPIEVVKTGKFAINDEYSIIFIGQVKKRQIDITEYSIPILCPAIKLITAHQKLKKLLPHNGINCLTDSNKSINNRLFTSSKSSYLKQNLFHSIYPPDAPNQTFNLRSIYTRVCYDTYQPEMSFRAYTAKILNHANLDSADSYDQYQST